MKKLILIIAIVLIIFGGFYFFSNLTGNQNNFSESKNATDLQSEQEMNRRKFKAKFAVYINGIRRDFSSSKYHNLSQDAYLESVNPHVIHVSKEIKWRDFFNTLPFSLNESCIITGTGEEFCNGQSGQLSFFLNGRQNSELLDMVIEEGDEVLITFGKLDRDIQKEILELSNLPL